MSKPIVYIDGKEGTTGLQIYDRLAQRQDIDLLLIDEDKRKDAAERKKCINAADIVFLCLPPLRLTAQQRAGPTALPSCRRSTEPPLPRGSAWPIPAAMPRALFPLCIRW